MQIDRHQAGTQRQRTKKIRDKYVGKYINRERGRLENRRERWKQGHGEDSRSQRDEIYIP